jgi:hypothetical protein
MSMVRLRKVLRVLDRIINIRPNDNGTDAMIVCKRSGFRNVDILMMSDVSYFKSLRYCNYNSDNIYIKISKNRDRILLNNQTDNILYHDDRQEVLTWFKKKQIHKIATTSDNHFICICSNPYDDKFDMLSTGESKFKNVISLRTAPGIFKFFDMKVV